MRINLSSQIDRIVFVYGLVRRSISNGGSHSSMAESSFFFYYRHSSRVLRISRKKCGSPWFPEFRPPLINPRVSNVTSIWTIVSREMIDKMGIWHTSLSLSLYFFKKFFLLEIYSNKFFELYVWLNGKLVTKFAKKNLKMIRKNYFFLYISLVGRW